MRGCEEGNTSLLQWDAPVSELLSSGVQPGGQSGDIVLMSQHNDNVASRENSVARRLDERCTITSP